VIWRCRKHSLSVSHRPLVMGIVNVTPDSFSDGGAFAAEKQAIQHGMRLAEEGADILDVGGESTRPGAAPVPVEEELRRVVPVIRALASQTGKPVSVDTMKASVADAALEAGASIINDVAAFRFDSDLFRVARESGAGVVLMHMRGEPRTMQIAPHYNDVVAEVGAFLRERAQAALDAGIARESIALDPGIGFGKTVEHNVELIRRLSEVAEAAQASEKQRDVAGERNSGRVSPPPSDNAGCAEFRCFPLLVGLSRKSFLGALTGRPVHDRLAASVAGAIMAWLRGASILRVHDVKETCDALLIAGMVNRDVRR
jgi:dihydropteroate synthase